MSRIEIELHCFSNNALVQAHVSLVQARIALVQALVALVESHLPQNPFYGGEGS